MVLSNPELHGGRIWIFLSMLKCSAIPFILTINFPSFIIVYPGRFYIGDGLGGYSSFCSCPIWAFTSEEKIQYEICQPFRIWSLFLKILKLWSGRAYLQIQSDAGDRMPFSKWCSRLPRMNEKYLSVEHQIPPPSKSFENLLTLQKARYEMM